jgi:hypothetical protein
MATKRIKDISTTATTFAADDFIALDASSVGTRKMAKASLITQVGANYLEKADNLSDVASKDTSKLNLEVPNVGTAANEVPVNGMLGDLAFQSSAGVVVDDLTVDGQLTAAVGKPMPVNGPTMRFDGSNDYITFADNDAFTFSNGTDDLPFSVSAWVKLGDATNCGIVSKYGSGASTREWLLYCSGSDLLGIVLADSGGNNASVLTAATVTAYEGQWIHVAAAYGGSGPNSNNAFTAAADSGNLELYINGVLQTGVTRTSTSYAGMSNTAQAVNLGRFNASTYGDLEIRNAQIFNKELSLAEVREVYSNGQLPESFAESTGAIAYAQDSTPSGEWAGVNATDADEAGPIGGKSNVLKMTINSSSSQHYLYIGSILTTGKRYRLNSKVYIPSTNSNMDGYQFQCGTSSPTVIAVDSSPTPDAWNAVSGEFVATAGSNPDRISIYGLDTGATSFTDAGGDDVLYVAETTITQIGSVLDARAENYNQSAGKLLDVSGNDFVGTQSGGVELLTPRSHLSAGTLDLTNLPTSATGLSAGEVYNDSGTLKIVS